MGVDLVLRIFILTTVSKICAGISGFSSFRVLRKHRQNKDCAGYIISYKNDYIGGRVSDRTNVCEGLPYFGHGTKLQKKDTIAVPGDGFEFAIPGTFNTGTRLALNVTMMTEKATAISFMIKDASDSQGFQLWFDTINLRRYFGVISDDPMTESTNTYIQAESQIAFEAQKDSIQLLIDGQEIATQESGNVRLDSLAYVAFRTEQRSGQVALYLHRFEFRDP